MRFTFKNADDYRTQREALLNKAQDLLNSGDIDGSNAEMGNITEMDNAYEDFSRAQANFNALNGIKPKNNAQNGVVDVIGMNNESEDIYNSMDYRKAFMNYVLQGSEMPEQFKNESTTTSDVGAVIPTTVLDKIIEKMESAGNIWTLVTRTNYKGGLSIPKSNVKPTAEWVAEGKGSNKQKKSTDGTITFAYHKLRCVVSISLEVDTMAIAAFETKVIENVSTAMIKAIEQAIINGDGVGKPKGILTEEPAAGQIVEISSAEGLTYASLCEAEGKLPLEYEEGAVWFMTKATFMKYIGMTDQQGQPIARVNYGIGGKPERTLLGRTVIANAYMESLSDTTESGTIVAFLFKPEDYVLNTNLNITIKQYEDNETDDTVTKAVALVDGQVVDVNSLVCVKVKNS